MPNEPTPKPELFSHTDARIKAQLEKARAGFTANLCDAFHTCVVRTALTVDGSPLATLTIAQMSELRECLREVVTLPPEDA